MLAKAVQEHDPGLSGFKRSTSSSQDYNATANVLKPQPSSIRNTAYPNLANPLKRTASQASGRESPFGSQEQGLKRAMLGMTQSSTDRGRLDSLHSPVFFDENDFENDEDIDLDAEDPQVARTSISSNASSSTLLPDLPQKETTTSQTPINSTPLPWSSSPLSHHQIPLPKPRTQTAVTAKRRTLPWIEDAKKPNQKPDQPRREKSERLREDLTGGVPPTSSKQDKKRSIDTAQGAPGKTYTPLPKDKNNSLYPWNKTASAVREEQKKLRQGHKKLVKDNEGESGKSNMKKKGRETVAKVFLSDEQRSVLDLVAEHKKSVFFTGSAGTGKSVLLRETIKVLRDKHRPERDRVAVTASTGLAACNVGGVTLHSFAGIGLGKEAVPELVKKIKRNAKAKMRWLRTKVLIVDEISMVDGDLFDKLEAIARAIRNNGRPFGGIQLIITGDFFQLPPVPDYGRVSKFSFDAATWNTSIEHTIGLTQVFRQKDPGALLDVVDQRCLLTVAVFANMLNEMRLGRLTPKSVDAFRALNRPLSFADDFEATEL